MEILGIGPSELLFVIIIALIVLGHRDMQKAGKTIGQYLNRLVKSDGWKAFQQTSRELRNLPTNLMREANVDLAETEKEIRKSIGPSAFAHPPKPTPAASSSSANPSIELRAGLNQPQKAENSTPSEPPSATHTDAVESTSTNEAPNTDKDQASAPNQNA